jgi:hypothetical protein
MKHFARYKGTKGKLKRITILILESILLLACFQKYKYTSVHGKSIQVLREIFAIFWLCKFT